MRLGHVTSGSNLITRRLFTFISRGTLSVVPRKLVDGLVPALPRSFQASVQKAEMVMVLAPSLGAMVTFKPGIKSMFPPGLLTPSTLTNAPICPDVTIWGLSVLVEWFSPMVMVLARSSGVIVIAFCGIKSTFPPSLTTSSTLLIMSGSILSNVTAPSASLGVVTTPSDTLRALRLYGDDTSWILGVSSVPAPMVIPSQYCSSKGRSNGILFPNTTLKAPLKIGTDGWFSVHNWTPPVAIS